MSGGRNKQDRAEKPQRKNSAAAKTHDAAPSAQNAAGMSLLYKTDSAKRRNISLIGSAATHIIMVLLLSLSGIFQPLQPSDDITEVAVFGGGGGGGSEGEEGADDADVPEQQEAAAEQAPEPEPEAIYEKDKSAPPAQAPKPAAKPKAKGGGGKGTGHGSGTGSGTGPGTGSGSGGGHGSGHGTGTGSGFGPGSGIYAAPAVPPRVVRSQQPSYPGAERKAGVEGTAVIQMLVGRDGRVETASVLTSSGSANLDAAAVSACRSWRFTSARNASGQNVRCYVSVPLVFRIRK